jgi:hypothetical protein
MLYDIGQWKVSKANIKKHLEIMRKFVEWQKQNRRKFFYMYSTFCVLKSEDSSVETWMYIDKYKDQESYDNSVKALDKSDPDYAGFFKIIEDWESLIVPNSYNCARWIEKPELCIT